MLDVRGKGFLRRLRGIIHYNIRLKIYRLYYSFRQLHCLTRSIKRNRNLAPACRLPRRSDLRIALRLFAKRSERSGP